jgi:hypothetical protein
MTGFDDVEFPPQPSRNPDQQTSEDTNPSTHSNNGNRQIKKRNRIPVSCNECRRRKLRCAPRKHDVLTRVDVIAKIHAQLVFKEAKPTAVNSPSLSLTSRTIPQLVCVEF